MTTSTRKEYNPLVREIIDEAYEICGLDPQDLEDRALRSARRSLNQVLVEWISLTTPLWLMQPVKFCAGGPDIAATRDGQNGIAWVENREEGGYIQFPSGVENIRALSIRLDDSNSFPVPLASMSDEDWNDYPIRSTEQTGQPYWYWFKREEAPKAYLVYQPDREYDFDAMLVRSPDAVISSNETVDIPRRWQSALAWGLARKLAIKVNVDANRMQMIVMESEKTLNLAKDGEDDGVELTMIHGEFT